MATITNTALAGFTVEYNGVQFGGSIGEDNVYGTTPPEYKLRGVFQYDEAEINVVRTVYTLSVHTCVVSSSGGLSDSRMYALKRLLGEPGGVLKLGGLGSGFTNIVPGRSAPDASGAIVGGAIDLDWGPKPRTIELNPLGPSSWELFWVVEFSVVTCRTGTALPNALVAFNFDTTWANDYEGLCQRTIAGYAEIAMRRKNNGLPLNTADIVRDQLRIVCPQGFRRTRNVWRENSRHNRVDFVISDEIMPGDPALPQGCIRADGQVTYASEGPGFAQAMVTMSMQLKTSPSFHPSIAAAIFLQAAQTKQRQMQDSAATTDKGIVIPRSIFISNGKFDRARETTASITWQITKCIKSMMERAGIWEPILDPKTNSYNKWRTSIANLWENRGAALIDGSTIRQDPNDVVVIDLCDNRTNVTIGDSAVPKAAPDFRPSFSFTCPKIPEDGGWIYHDLRVRFISTAHQSWHREAASWIPSVGSTGSPSDDTLGGTIALNGPAYDTLNAHPHVVEYHGHPVVMVALQFVGIRLMRKPPMPELDTVGGFKTHILSKDGAPWQQIEGPRILYETPCPVWITKGYRIYGINGYVSRVAVTGSPTSCAAPNTATPSGAATPPAGAGASPAPSGRNITGTFGI